MKIKNKLKLLIIIIFIIVNINDSKSQTYEIDLNQELYITGINSLILTVSYFNHSNFDLSEIKKISLDKNKIFFPDNLYYHNYNKSISDISDYFLGLNIALPLITNFSSFNENNSLYIIYFENLLSTFALTSLVKTTFKRARPFNFYKNDFEDSQKDDFYSFFSGHSSLAFSSAIFNCIIFSKLNANCEYKNLVWILSLTNSSITAFLRVLAGKHFISDVIVGAIIGSSVAYLITELHYHENIKDGDNINIFYPIRIRINL
mgnify:CR=1 FL=1